MRLYPFEIWRVDLVFVMSLLLPFFFELCATSLLFSHDISFYVSVFVCVSNVFFFSVIDCINNTLFGHFRNHHIVINTLLVSLCVCVCVRLFVSFILFFGLRFQCFAQ